MTKQKFVGEIARIRERILASINRCWVFQRSEMLLLICAGDANVNPPALFMEQRNIHGTVISLCWCEIKTQDKIVPRIIPQDDNRYEKSTLMK